MVESNIEMESEVARFRTSRAKAEIKLSLSTNFSSLKSISIRITLDIAA